MKVLDNGRIQMNIGEEVQYHGRTYVVARDMSNFLYCGNCPFRDERKCPRFACSVSRDDGEVVHFEEVKKND